MTPNPYQADDFVRASEHLRLALALLGKHRIPPSPFNFRLGYDHVLGGHPRLSDALQQQLAQDQVDPHSLWPLYQQFYGDEDQGFHQLRDELKGLIEGLQSEFAESGVSLTNYASGLDRFAERLEQAGTFSELSADVQKVLQDTRSVQRCQRQLEDDMSQAVEGMESLRRELEQVREESRTDALTGVGNRKAFDERLAALLDSGSGFSLVLFDIDHFKRFNDTYGHLVGDKVIRFVATILSRSVADAGQVARYGGEEFALLLPGGSRADALALAERLRQTVSSRVLRDSVSEQDYGTVTASAGVAAYRPGDSADDLIDRCDAALYRAKRAGRNRVEAASD